MKAKNDPMLADYLKEYRRITEAIINPLNPNGSYLYFNTSWGEYYYLLALNNLNAKGLLSDAVSDATMANLKKRLTFCDVFGPDGTGSFDTCPLAGTPIDGFTQQRAELLCGCLWYCGVTPETRLGQSYFQLQN
jgi:hypothetical protein